MKKLSLILLLLPFITLSQYNLDSIGNNDKTFLNVHEHLYLKELLGPNDSIISLDNKRIHFSTNNWGAIPLSKSTFFNSYCKPRTKEGMNIQLVVLELSDVERQELNIDIVIIAWSKITPVGKARKKFIDNLRQQI